MKKYLLTALVVAGLAAIFLLAFPDTVSAFNLFSGGSAGSWTWDDESVTGTIIPQYQLAAGEDDYAVPQSNGLAISGPTRICHPYPNGQFGWTAQIRVLTSSGWQAVPTVNEWVPDEEGQFMTCAKVWYRGTYAVFGYWEKPDGWMANTCPTLPAQYDTYIGSVKEFDLLLKELFVGIGSEIRCAVPTDPDYVPGGLYLYFEGEIDAVLPLPLTGVYCACDSLYMDSGFVPPD